MLDYYKILEISVTATSDDIKKSYRRLTLIYHPDRNAGNREAEVKFRLINEAYEILSDYYKRQNYDYEYNKERQPKPPQESNKQKESSRKDVGFNPYDLLSDVAKVMNQVSGKSKKKVNQEALYTVLVRLLSDNNILSLLINGNSNVNKDIIENVLLCFKTLDYKYIEPLSKRIITLAANDKDLISKISKTVKLNEKRDLIDWRDLKDRATFFGASCLGTAIGVLILPASALLSLFVISLFDKKTTSSDSPTPQVSTSVPSHSQPTTYADIIAEHEANLKRWKEELRPINYIAENGRDVNPDEKLYALYVRAGSINSYKDFKKRYANESGMYQLFQKQKSENKYTKSFEEFKQDYSYLPIGQDYTIPHQETSKSTSSPSVNTTNSKSEYLDWDKEYLPNGSTPSCSNFYPSIDTNIDNKLVVTVGSNTDVVIKLINYNTGNCIRYVYIRGGTTYNIRHIPEGRYYTKIAYGTDWRKKIINGKCVGKFIRNALYKKGDEILDFNKIYQGTTREGDYERAHYSIASYSLKLDVVA